MNTYVNCCALVLLFSSGITTSIASEPQRDANVDLIKIATRYVDNYSKSQHKAGDVDGIFIEDVVIPSVVSAANGYQGNIPSAARIDLYRFLIAGEAMASEELATLAGNIYRKSPKLFCSDVRKLNKSDRLFLIRQASDGLALSGTNLSKANCT